MHEYTFYPGCSSESKTSASHSLISTESVCKALGMGLKELDDWNCCGASIGYAKGGELPRLTLSARNLALAAPLEHDVVATCAACWLALRETNERLNEDPHLMAEANEALAAGGLKYDGSLRIRHLVEVLIEDIGFDAISEKVSRPLTGLKVAGYVGCQTNRPFGVAGDNFENPEYLDKMMETLGATPTSFNKKVACCGGGLGVPENDKSVVLIRDILEAAEKGGAEVIVTPCPACQLNVEIYQDKINETFGTNYHIPVVFYTQLMALALGLDYEKDAALNRNLTESETLKKLAGK